MFHVDPPLSCTAMKSFWISWFDDTLKVGFGSDVGYNDFMSHQGEPWYTIHAASISTGFGIDGQWRWPLNHGNISSHTLL